MRCVTFVGERGDQARHLLIGVQKDHQQGRCVRVPRARALKHEALAVVDGIHPACGARAALLRKSL